MLKLNNFVDELLDELQSNTITTICGPPGCGKSTLLFQYSNSCLKQNKKVIFIDTEGGFSPERLKQINPEIDLQNIIVLSPKSFEQQSEVIEKLNEEITNNKNIGLVIIDSLVMLYRLKLGDAPQKINSELGEQLRLLNEVSRNFDIPILISNQIYKDFETKETKMVGGDVTEYWSKTILEIKKEFDVKSLLLRKHKYKKSGTEIKFEIHNQGLVELNKRSFGFFSK